MKTKVTLREKILKNGRLSLYLDFYPPIIKENGKSTRRHFLKMSILENPKTLAERKQNKETRLMAESIAYKYQMQYDKPEIYNDFEKEQLHKKEKGEQDFIEYIKKIADKRTGSNYQNWISSINYLESYTKGKFKFKDITETFAEDYKHFLLNTYSTKRKKTKLSHNSAQSYFTKFKTALKQAYKEGFLQTDINARITNIKEQETKREFLTYDELIELANTEFDNITIKNLSIFSALTGLRFSDVTNLTWNDVQVSGNEYLITFRQEKTKGMEYQPISEEAYNLLIPKEDLKEKIFNIKYSAHNNEKLKKWIKKTSIKKHITFHSFRHTYATLQLTFGSDLYTISKMLGHKNIKTTQIYAKIVDEKKQQTTNKIKLGI